MISPKFLVIKFSTLDNWLWYLCIPSFCYTAEHRNFWVIHCRICHDIKIYVFVGLIVSLVHYIKLLHLIMQILLIQIESNLLMETITDTVQNVEDIHSNFLTLKQIFLTILLLKSWCVDTCIQNFLTQMGNVTTTFMRFQFMIRFLVFLGALCHTVTKNYLYPWQQDLSNAIALYLMVLLSPPPSLYFSETRTMMFMLIGIGFIL